MSVLSWFVRVESIGERNYCGLGISNFTCSDCWHLRVLIDFECINTSSCSIRYAVRMIEHVAAI